MGSATPLKKNLIASQNNQNNLTCHPPHPIENENLGELLKQILPVSKAQRMAEFF